MKTLAAVLVAASALAPTLAAAQAQNPIIDAAAAKVVQKYQSASCEQLADERAAPKSAEKTQTEERVAQILRQDPQARAAFVNKVAAPIANKMIECGLVP